MYIVSCTDRLLRCIISLQCGKTRATLQAGMKTCITLRQFDYIHLNSEIYAYVSNFVSLHFEQSDSGVLKLIEELCITRVATTVFIRHRAQNPGGAFILPSTDSFVMSQLFIMLRHVRYSKPGSKPA